MKTKAVSSLPEVYKVAEDRLLAGKTVTSELSRQGQAEATNQVETGEESILAKADDATAVFTPPRDRK